MTHDELVQESKEIIADGIGCDRCCVNYEFCGCKADAEKIIQLTQEFMHKSFEQTPAG